MVELRKVIKLQLWDSIDLFPMKNSTRSLPHVSTLKMIVSSLNSASQQIYSLYKCGYCKFMDEMCASSMCHRIPHLTDSDYNIISAFIFQEHDP